MNWDNRSNPGICSDNRLGAQIFGNDWDMASGWHQDTMTLNWWHRPMSAITRAVSSRRQWWLCRDLCSWLEPMMEIRPRSALRFTEQRMPAEITSLKLLVWNTGQLFSPLDVSVVSVCQYHQIIRILLCANIDRRIAKPFPFHPKQLR